MEIYCECADKSSKSCVLNRIVVVFSGIAIVVLGPFTASSSLTILNKSIIFLFRALLIPVTSGEVEYVISLERALSRGVCPSESLALISAPALINNSAISTKFHSQAICKGVNPFLSTTFLSALFLINELTIL